MERLTHRDPDGNVRFGVDEDKDGSYDITDLVHSEHYSQAMYATELLAQYEETGLTPEQVAELQAKNERLRTEIDAGGRKMSGTFFDDLIRDGHDTDALRLMAREQYDHGKIGHTRMLLMVRVADENERLHTDKLDLQTTIESYHCEIDNIRAALAKAEAERDAAIDDCERVADCEICKHQPKGSMNCMARGCIGCYKYRGTAETEENR